MRGELMTINTVYCLSGTLTIFSDMIVIAVTWRNTRISGTQVKLNRAAIVTLMFRDGAFFSRRAFLKAPPLSMVMYYLQEQFILCERILMLLPSLS